MLRRFRRVGLGVLAGLLAVAIVAVTAVGSLWLSMSGIRREAALLPARDAVSAPGTPGSLNLLLIGTDSQYQRGRANVLLVIHVDGSRQRVHVVSLPRELLVTGSDGSPVRLGPSYVQRGSAATVDSVETLLGVRIDHVAITWLPGMSRLIDLLGGVPVDNPVDATSEGFAFPRGRITLSGEEALAFVRQDAGTPGELDRAESQRLVLQGIVERLLTSNALLNPGTVKAVLDQLAGDIVVDDGLDARAMIELFVDLRLRSDQRSLEAVKLPTGERGALPTGERYVLPDQAKVTTLGRALNTDTMDTWVP
ncbi:MAG: LCP family protein [Micropruina sp.]|uniref:LCP family protein n=1 Tax=Micropruina sp. TaxID=2737536 RepID=UPI0039E504DC